MMRKEESKAPRTHQQKIRTKDMSIAIKRNDDKRERERGKIESKNSPQVQINSATNSLLLPPLPKSKETSRREFASSRGRRKV